MKHARYYRLLLAESHLTRRLSGSMVRQIGTLPLPTYDEHSKGTTIPSAASKGNVIFYHDLRNEMYHSGNGLVPEEDFVLAKYADW